MNTRRPYLQHSIFTLEQLVADSNTSTSTLRAILKELEHRDTDRADRLRKRIQKDLASKAVPPVSEGRLFAQTPQTAAAETDTWFVPMQAGAPSSIANQPLHPASTQVAETLSPQSLIRN